VGRRLLVGAAAPRHGEFHPHEDRGDGSRLALFFSAAVALSSSLVEYAQEARMYAALVAETLLLSWLYLRWLDRQRRGDLAAYAIVGGVSLLTHYFALWVLLAHAVHALWIARVSRDGPSPLRARPILAATVAAGLLFLPWFLWMVTHPQRIATGDPHEPFGRLLYVVWRSGAGPGLAVVDRPRLDGGPMEVLAEEGPIVLLTALLWFPSLVLGVLALRTRPGLGRYLLASLFVPVLVLLAIHPFLQLIHERYLVFLAPWLWLLAIVGASSVRAPWRTVLEGGLALLLLLGLVAYHGASPALSPTGPETPIAGRRVPRSFDPPPEDPLRVLHHGHPFGKEPWRQAQEFVEALSRPGEPGRPGDLVLLHPWYLRNVWPYYDRGRLETVELPEAEMSQAEFDARYGETIRGRERVFVVLAHEETEDRDAYFRLAQACAWRLWYEVGATHVEAAGPILFNHSWGVRVGVLNRR